MTMMLRRSVPRLSSAISAWLALLVGDRLHPAPIQVLDAARTAHMGGGRGEKKNPKTIKLRRAALSAACAALIPLAAAADPVTAVHLRDQALKDDTAWSILESLTTEIGPRPAGSPAAARARDWGVAKLTALGFTNVHVEPFSKKAWARGAESGEIVGPYPQKLALIGLGRSAPTPKGGLTAQVVVFSALADLKAAPADCCTGKIVLVNQPMTRTQGIDGYGTAVAARYGAATAAAHGAVAYLTRSISTSANRSPHTGVTQQGDKAIPAAALGVSDADLIADMAKRGPVTLHLVLDSRWVDATAWNVAGELPGSDPSAGTIVIGGHLDSWDPGTGAIDDAAGVAITTAAAKLVGATPHRRTLRVVMWGSEETGGAGAAYLAAHKSEVGGMAIAGESDLGADAIYSLQLPKGAWDAPDIAPLESVLAPLKVMAIRKPASDGGSDVEDIQGAGVPVLALNQDASRYFDYHHTADDTLAIVDPAQLRQNVAAWAATLSILADTRHDFRTGDK